MLKDAKSETFRTNLPFTSTDCALEILYIPREEIFQSPNACSQQFLIAGITLHMLEQATEITKHFLAIRALVSIIAIPASGVALALIAGIGKPIELIAISTTFADARLEMNQHS
ncbi:hypothetical protein GJ744_004901 [Endocarpon pusillum]|uniref:Uncharacterized protein n=1 Tax=Endocarpon pusillum TaxID=364733 RepID=A0A8H7AQH6_9EURO|nr:hypothetical protein GJ744_004901 [Endocarpon pusillum]